MHTLPETKLANCGQVDRTGDNLWLNLVPFAERNSLGLEAPQTKSVKAESEISHVKKQAAQNSAGPGMLKKKVGAE